MPERDVWAFSDKKTTFTIKNIMIKGLDRSHLNSSATLASLVAKGIQFIFFKASQGLTYTDPTFDASWKEAIKTPGLKRGAYHFFNPQVDGIAQGQHFLSLGIDFSKPGCFAPAVDVEDLVGTGKAQTDALNKWVADNWQLALQRLTDFLNYVKQHTGRDCIIYTYNNYPKEYFHGHGFPNNEMWISSIQDNPPLRYDTGKVPLFWQNTYRYQGSDQDGDYFTGTVEQFNLAANITQ